MSRSRMAVAALLVPVAAGAVALLGAGAASAATPYSGNGFVGVNFDQNETRFIADTNAGNLLGPGSGSGLAREPRPWFRLSAHRERRLRHRRPDRRRGSFTRRSCLHHAQRPGALEWHVRHRFSALVT